MCIRGGVFSRGRLTGRWEKGKEKKGSDSELKGLLSVDAAEHFEAGCLISFEIASARTAHCDAELFRCCVFSVPSGCAPLPVLGFFFLFLTDSLFLK